MVYSMKMFLKVTLLSGAILAVSCFDQERTLTGYERLLRDVQTYGTPGTIPRSGSGPLELRFGLVLLDVALDEETGRAEVFLWERFKWNDYLLSWNPEDYDGLDLMHVPATAIWNPISDWKLYNGLDMNSDIDMDTRMGLYSDGNALWVPPVKHRIICLKEDNNSFLRDVWNCRLKFGSWAYDGRTLMPYFYENQASMDVSHLLPNNHGYEITKNTARIDIEYYECCGNIAYPSMTFEFSLTRTRSWGKVNLF